MDPKVTEEEEGENREPAAAAAASAGHLSAAKKRMHLDVVRRAMQELQKQGLSKQEVIDMMQQGEESSEEDSLRQTQHYNEEEVKRILQDAKEDPQLLLSSLEQYGVRDKYKSLAGDDARIERLQYHLNGRHAKHDSVSLLLEDVRTHSEQFHRASKKLFVIGRKLLKFLNEEALKDGKLNEFFSRDLPDVMKRMNASLQRLKEGQCPILVTGEVNAGKSTFLNLLFHGLGIELPNSEKETTSCVCEIKHGKEKKVTVHRRKPKDGEADTFDVDPVTNEVLNELINFEALKQTPSKLPYKKIEIFLPSEFLQTGLVLVDTPGVGSDREGIEEFIDEYLQHSVGFIYVLTNAVRVHRLCRLFEMEKSAVNSFVCSDEDVEELTSGMSRNTMFIANKWDLSKNPSMLEEIREKLEKHWLTDPNDQSKVLKLSAVRDMEHFKAGYVSDRLQDVITNFNTIVPYNMKLQIRRHYRLMQLLCSRIEYHTQRYLNHAALIEIDQLDEVQTEAERRLEKLLALGKQKTEKFETFIRGLDLGAVGDSLEEHLKQSQVRSKLVVWRREECPEDVGHIGPIEDSAKQKVQERIKKVIEEWEDENHMLDYLRQQIATQIQQSLKEIDADIASVTRAVMPINPIEIDAPGFRFDFLERSQRFYLHFLRTFTSFFDLDFLQRRRKAFVGDPTKSMEEMASETLKSLFIRQNLLKLLSRTLGLEKIATNFRETVQAATENASKEVRDLRCKETAPFFRRVYKPIRDHCRDLHTNLLKWELDFMFEGVMIQSEHIVIRKEVPIGSGMLTGYYRGKNTESCKDVTVKRYTMKGNLRAILNDFKSLRKHNSEFIAKVVGMVQLKTPLTTELAVVMESCEVSLEEWLKTSPTERLGAYQKNPETIINSSMQIALDITNGVTALHIEDYIHGDLSPGTVMMTKSNHLDDQSHDATPKYRAKLFHFGLKVGADVEMTEDGLPFVLSRYCAPERVGSTNNCRNAVDIYSLGHLLADLWFGTEHRPFNLPDSMRPYKEDKTQSTGNGLSDDEVPTMSLLEAFSSCPTVGEAAAEGKDATWFRYPPKLYSCLVRLCCDSNPKKRPSITNVKSQLVRVNKQLEAAAAKDTEADKNRHHDGTYVQAD